MIQVDRCDRWLLQEFTFSAVNGRNTQYARVHVPGTGGVSAMKMYLHHCIVGQPLPGYEVDHLDHNGLNNSRCNISVVTKSCNRINSKMYSNNKSGYRGVYISKEGNFVAQIVRNGVTTHVGTFYSAKEAAMARAGRLR